MAIRALSMLVIGAEGPRPANIARSMRRNMVQVNPMALRLENEIATELHELQESNCGADERTK